MSHSLRRLLAIPAAVMLAVPATGIAATGDQAPRAAAPASATPPPIPALGCVEHEGWVDGDAAAVRSALPRQYSPVTDSNGAPIVFARAERCNELLDGDSHPVVIADWGVVITTPDGTGCSSGVPRVGAAKGDLPPACNWYTLGLASNDAHLVAWLRQGTPGVAAEYSRHLSYRETATASGQSSLHFSTGRTLPWGFTLDDTSSYRPGTIALRGNYWFATRHGTVRMLVSTDDLTTGAASTTVRAPAHSALARLMGQTSRQSVQPYAQFGVIDAAHGVVRKQIDGPPQRGERVLRFAGSCSLQGDVTFTPAAGMTQRPTTYSYAATGTCTGTLNGHPLNNAPVRLQQAGHADASCRQAMSFPPGTGTVTFAPSLRLPYTLDFEGVGTELDGTAYGTRSGQGPGHGTFLTERSTPALATGCATAKARVAPMDLTFTTHEDLVSDAP